MRTVTVFLVMCCTVTAADMPKPNWVFRARPVRVIDGDTFVVEINLGFDLTLKRHLRVHGIEAAPANTENGKAATAFVEKWMTVQEEDDEWPLVVQTMKWKGSFGRYIAQVWRTKDKQQLGPALIKAKHAVSTLTKDRRQSPDLSPR